MKKLPYSEGDLFALPIGDCGYAIGLVARSGPRGRVLYGCFFARRYAQVPSLSELPHFAPGDALLRCQFGDLGLIDGRWHVLGPMPGWERPDWKMPPFIRQEPITGRRVQVIYSDSDPNILVSETALPADAGAEPQDGMAGAGYVELELGKMIAEMEGRGS